MELRSYQQQAISKILWAKNANLPGNDLVVLPQGSGKSVVIAHLAKQLNEPILIIQPTKEILMQNLEKLCRYVERERIGVYSASMKEKIVKHYTFATIGSIYKKPEEFKHFKLIIIDESHLVNIKNLTGMFASFLKAIDSPKVIGLTATPYRLDTSYKWENGELTAYSTVKLINRMKGFFWKRILCNVTTQSLIDQKFLCPLEYIDRSLVQHSEIPLNKTHSEFDLVKYEEMLSDKQFEIVKAIEYAKSIAKSVLVFCSSVRQAEKFAALMNGAVVSAKTKANEREDIVNRFKSGEEQVVFNMGVLTTGFDHPSLDCIVLLRPVRSIGLYCLDLKTEILTPNGFKKYNELEIGQNVYGFEKETNEIKIVKVKNKIFRDIFKNENFYSIKTNSVDIRTTDKHRMLYDRKSNSGWKIKEMKKLALFRDGFKIPCAGIEKSNGVPLTDAELRFIGWVMTDGNINKHTNGITITQGEHQPQIKDLEKCLIDCGFKYNKFIKNSKSQFKRNSNCIAFTISKGKPRGTKKHLRGWELLEPFLSKDFHNNLMKIDSRQFDILIEAIHLGDGTKYLNQPWTRRSYHIGSGNKIFTDRLQGLAVKKGYRCNLKVAHYNKNPFYTLHLKKQPYRFIGGKNQIDRQSIQKENYKKEKCWCVTNDLETIITRRNGKVCIMGNSQMLGRGLRIAKGKKNCKVIDLTSTVQNIGRVETIRIEKKEKWEIVSERGSWHNFELYSFKIKKKEKILF